MEENSLDVRNSHLNIGFGELDLNNVFMISQKPKILFVLPSFAVKWGGPCRVVHDICANLSSKFNFTILTTSHNDEDEILSVPEDVKFISFTTQKPLANLWKSFSTEVDDWLEVNIRKFDLVHIHEMWHYSQFAAARKASKFGIPYIVSPHGELDAWRISHKPIRKKIFGSIFQKRMLREAGIVHSLTQHEAQSVERFAGATKNIRVIPNSITIDKSIELVETPHSRPYILFLGRLQQVKGCWELLQAFTYWEGNKDYDLLFAGLFEDTGYEQKMMAWIKSNNLQEKVHFKGLVSGTAKNALLQNASLFVLPSFSEGFPVSVLEAMQAEIPLLISVNTGLNQLMEEMGAALVCESTVASIIQNLEAFLKMTPTQLESMVERASSVLDEYFSREKVMHQYEILYLSLIHSPKNIPA